MCSMEALGARAERRYHILLERSVQWLTPCDPDHTWSICNEGFASVPCPIGNAVLVMCIVQVL